MPDDLDVSGGTTSVATEDLDTAAQQLTQLCAEAADLAGQLGRFDPIPAAPTFYTSQSSLDIDVAAGRLTQISRRSQILALLLETAATGYLITDRLMAAGLREIETRAAHWMGERAPGILMSSGLLGSVAGGAWLAILASGGAKPVAGKSDGIPKASPLVRENNRLFNNAATVSAVRSMAQTSGAFMLGAVGQPQWPGSSLVVGARGMTGAGQTLGLFEETPVRLVGTERLPLTEAPSSYADRLERVPYFEEGSGPQVVVEKYSVAGEPSRFSVFVTGTVSFSPVTTTEPWDMTSNMMNAAGFESGSAAAVRAAMQEAGIDKDSPVQLTGYSQGGGTVASIAASGDYNVQGVVTFGGPTGQILLPTGIPVVLVEHSDDIVPALGGEQNNRDAVLVRRDVFAGEPPTDKYGVPSHHIEYYLQTAKLMDESGSAQLDDTLARLDAFTDGAKLVSSTAYRYERVSE